MQHVADPDGLTKSEIVLAILRNTEKYTILQEI